METKTFINNGAAETKLFGEETYIQCCLGAFRGEIYFDYKYRHTNGQEFTTLRRTLVQCRAERDFWLREKTVSFSGHRAERMTRNSPDTQKRLIDIGFDTYTAITELCKRDYHTFLSGMANGIRPYRSRGSSERKKDVSVHSAKMCTSVQRTGRPIHPSRQAAL